MTTDVVGVDTELLKAIAEPLRWRILRLLAVEELCVCHLVETLDVAQPLVSHHLRVLREVGLVESERHRYWTYYRLARDALAALGHTISAMADDAPSCRRPATALLLSP